MEDQLHLDPRLQRRIIEKRAALDRQRPLPARVVDKLYEDLRVRLTYHSNAIEGNTLDLSETQLVLEHGVTIGGHTVKEHLEAINHGAAFSWLVKLARGATPLTEADVLHLHALITKDLVEPSGAYRAGAVHISGSNVRPPPAQQVPGLMRDWLAWLEGDGRDYEAVVRAALAHEMFLAIHPFADGNGRTARLLLNLQLMRDGYPTAVILQGWRPAYIRALEAAHHGTYPPLLNLIGRAVEHGLDMFAEAVAAVPEEERRPLREVAGEVGMEADYLGWLLRAGRVAGTKQGGRWYTSAAAVRRYQDEVARREVPIGRPRRSSRTTGEELQT